MPLPFEVPAAEIERDPDLYVDSVFGMLESAFFTIPKGRGYVEYSVFEAAYEALKKSTRAFEDFTADRVEDAVGRAPMAFVVLRAILGFSPSEWAEATAQGTGRPSVTQQVARSLDRRIRLAPSRPVLGRSELTDARIRVLVKTACDLVTAGGPPASDVLIHRLDKADTGGGLSGVRRMAQLGSPYAVLLYERFLGRPFASHRDSVSELVGDVLETAVERVLANAGVSFRKTARAERIPGFDQAPDFVAPSEFEPRVVIEAKIAEDDGTARDKVTRVQHLGSLARTGAEPGAPGRFEVVAVIGGRGFRTRREDMRKLLLATEGKVFTLRQLHRLVPSTRLAEFAAAT